MKYMKASMDQIQLVYEIVQSSIKSIYPKYYPKEVVDFFASLHSQENITKDIEKGNLGILFEGNLAVGTGCFEDEHITRVYVRPECQGMGYGSFIMDCLEKEITQRHRKISLDASLPASHLYEKRGYRTLTHRKWNVENGVILVYEIMEKEFTGSDASETKKKKMCTAIDYDGRIFVPEYNTENGEVSGQTIFHYHQSGNDFSAEYAGGDVKTGYMVGKVSESGELSFFYQHLNVFDELRVGKCESVPEVMENGKMKLHETWQWLNGDCSTGESVVMEQ